MSREATILHADADAFFAAVEQRDNPRLRGRPVVVGSGVVMAASYEARAYGIHGAMPGSRARRLCPGLVSVDPRFDAYTAASRELFAIFEELAPVVEAISIEEAFLDVSGLERICGTPEEIARRLRHLCRERAGLAVTVGVASSRVVAKIASRAAKPDGLVVVPAGREQEFLHPLPVEAIWGVGPATAERLRAGGIETIGDAAQLSEADVAGLVGRAAGRYVHAVSRGRGPRRVRRRPRRRSVGSQHALRPTRSARVLDRTLVGLADRVARRTRAGGRVGRTVVLRVRFADRSRISRSRTLARPTAETAAVLAAARGLLEAALPARERRAVTLLGVALTNLERTGGTQLALPIAGARHEALDAAIDAIRERFGSGALTRATLLGAESRLATWLMPGDDEAADDRP